MLFFMHNRVNSSDSGAGLEDSCRPLRTDNLMITARNLHAKLTILGARYLFDHGCELVVNELSTQMNGLP
ncbi:MAG: hypothetical protein ACYCW6_26305, partial [Candidatus Xenobia bacterium]